MRQVPTGWNTLEPASATQIMHGLWLYAIAALVLAFLIVPT